MFEEQDFQPAIVQEIEENLADLDLADENNQRPLINIGDILHSRYQVLRELGHGWYSLVWLCKDLQNDRSIALKVLKDEPNISSSYEIEFLKHVKETDPDNGKIVILLDDFNITGPDNKTHACMVFDVFGCSLDEMLARNRYQAIPLPNVKSIIRQVLEGLDFLHTRCQLVHGDLKLKNILLESEGDANPAVEVCDFRIKIVDLGYAYTMAEDLGYKRPTSYGVEVLLSDGNQGPSHDIWNTALFAFEMATGADLFTPKSGEGYTTDEDHLAQIIQLLGEVPLNMATTGSLSQRYFNEKGELRYKGNYKQSCTLFGMLTGWGKWEEDAAKTFEDFLLPMLDYDISKRPSAAQLLQHPWLQQDA